MMPTTPQHPTQKFLFDRTFDSLSPTRVEPTKPPVYTQADLDAAKQSAFKDGYTQGEQTANREQTARIAAIVEKIDGALGKLLQGATAQQLAQQADAQDIALAIARKLLPDFIARHGFGEIEAVLVQVLKEMVREPRLVVRVHDQVLDALQHAVQDIAARAAYAGKIVLLADDKLNPNDCKIEWADGGVERDVNIIWQEVDRAMGRIKSFSGSAAAASVSPTVESTDSTTTLAI